MRILSWNINGIRTLPQYHPWYTMKTCEAMLTELKADIICFQEMKIPRTSLERPVALPGQFNSVFSFPISNKGYSGVAVYTDSRVAVPHKAEEGLTSILQPKPPLSPEERVSTASSYPSPVDFDFYPEEDGTTQSDFQRAGLDDEGRTVVLDYGLFVLINVYCPAQTSDARVPFKMNFHRLLEKRVKNLIDDGREVIVVGDINSTAAPIDFGEGTLPSKQNVFWEHPARAWFKQWREPEGPMIDAIRQFHPDREGMFTCWNTILSARESNYGSRIDYILITKGLSPWLEYGDIQADIRGSDHCPVYIDLKDEITLPSGDILTLREAMGMVDSQGAAIPREPPRIAAKFWPEFLGKQTLVSTFFSKKGTAPVPTSQSVTPQPVVDDSIMEVPPPVIQSQPEASVESSTPPSQKSLGKRKQIAPEPSTSPAPTSNSKGSKKAKTVNGQTKLSTFFANPAVKREARQKPSVKRPPPSLNRSTSSTTTLDAEIIAIDSDDGEDLPSTSSLTFEAVGSQDDVAMSQIEADYMFAASLAEGEAIPESVPKEARSDSSAWKSLLAPLQPPLCTVHMEPAKRFTVNKTGPNKGKTFFVCSRPVGPGYDKGRTERLRQEVNPEYRCDFFKWASDARKEASRS